MHGWVGWGEVRDENENLDDTNARTSTEYYCTSMFSDIIEKLQNVN